MSPSHLSSAQWHMCAPSLTCTSWAANGSPGKDRATGQEGNFWKAKLNSLCVLSHVTGNWTGAKAYGGNIWLHHCSQYFVAMPVSHMEALGLREVVTCSKWQAVAEPGIPCGSLREQHTRIFKNVNNTLSFGLWTKFAYHEYSKAVFFLHVLGSKCRCLKKQLWSAEYNENPSGAAFNFAHNCSYPGKAELQYTHSS